MYIEIKSQCLKTMFIKRKKEPKNRYSDDNANLETSNIQKDKNKTVLTKYPLVVSEMPKITKFTS